MQLVRGVLLWKSIVCGCVLVAVVNFIGHQWYVDSPRTIFTCASHLTLTENSIRFLFLSTLGTVYNVTLFYVKGKDI